MDILKKLRSRFPAEEIKRIVNARSDKPINLIASDITKAVPGDHEQCAFYWAGKRLFPNAKIFVSRSLMFVIHGGQAIRYRLGEQERAEAARVDAGQKAAKGKYWLKAYAPTRRTGLSQKSIILQRLREAGDNGFSKRELEKEFSQAPARISELQDEGYKIISRYPPGNKFVNYSLISEPRKPTKSVRPKISPKRKYRKTEMTELRRTELWAV
jgi:hypothetical protein